MPFALQARDIGVLIGEYSADRFDLGEGVVSARER